jgi:hypothetical protein
MQEDDGRRSRFWEKEKSSWRQKRKKEIFMRRSRPRHRKTTQERDAERRGAKAPRQESCASNALVLRKSPRRRKRASRKHPTEEEKKWGTPPANERHEDLPTPHGARPAIRATTSWCPRCLMSMSRWRVGASVRWRRRRREGGRRRRSLSAPRSRRSWQRER